MLFNPWALEDAQETNLLIFWNWIYFSCFQLNHFLVPVFYPLFTDAPFVVPELFPLMGADVCAVSGAIILTHKGQGWSKTGRKKGTNVSVRVTETGGKVGDKLCHMKHYICKAACGITASMPPWHTSRMTFWSQCVCGGVRGIQHHPPTSQLWKQNFILTLRGGVEIGDNKASEGRNYSLVLIVGLQEGGWR